ncbi:hypothetical protein [Halomonas denitrificans]|uniref:hypothetical protein n=1 Tax=Halomonas denitrificans TaxID=370769 RepID=UPI0013009466|nr:hypothetical protein [Halomonas denitrificans]
MNFRDLKDIDSWSLKLDQGVVGAHGLFSWLIEERFEFSWHPLGFAMCRIAKWGPVSLRVHIWPVEMENQQKPAWLIHDHRFHLTSWVLAGSLENREYQIDYSGSDFAIYNANYSGDKSLLNKTSASCSKKLTRKIILGKGEVYEVNSGVFHESLPRSNCSTFTICRTIDELDSKPKVLGERKGKRTYAFCRRQVEMLELRELLSGI